MTNRFSRRQMLAGAAAAGILAPFARFGRRAQAQSADVTGKVKALLVYVPDGCIPGRWHPTGSETSFALNEMTSALEPVKQHINFLQGIDMYSGGATHEGGIAKVLTGTDPVSLDIFLGQRLNARDQLPHASLQLGAAANFQNGSGSFSFLGQGIAVRPDDDPLSAFRRVFGAAPGGGGEGGGEVSPELLRRRSILDLASADIERTRRQLGSVEQEKLDIHLSSFREVERRVQGVPGGGAACDPSGFNARGFAVSATDYYPKTYEKEEHFQTVGELQMDLAALALSCKQTRVVSMMWSHPVSPTRIAGGAIGNHDSSHYGSPDSATAQAFVANKRWFMDRFAYLIGKLNATPDPDGGTLLDNSIVFLCSELGDGNLHDHRNMPFLLAGRAAGQMRTGRLLDYSGSANGDNQPHTKLLTSIANMMGEPIDRYGYTGHGTGPLPGLQG